MRPIPVLLVAGVLALAGCGDDYGSSDGQGQPSEPAATPTKPDETAPKEPAATADGTEIELGESEFGTMLFDAKDQAIYIFEKDPKNETVCYGECADAWPPVFTDGEPKAGKGVRQSLLGTVERRDGKRQVTYAGKPLYFYAHEKPGEVRCHNVNLNGGFWWVVGPDGKRRA